MWAESGISTQEELKEIVHRPGNLTLLDKELNMTAQNRKFSEKNAEYYKDSIIPMNHYFKGMKRWTTVDIELRTFALCVAATEMWPHPVDGKITEREGDALLTEYRSKKAEDLG